jgi:hypothetical protein
MTEGAGGLTDAAGDPIDGAGDPTEGTVDRSAVRRGAAHSERMRT